MAWIKCSKCGKRISDKEVKCDRCGKILKDSTNSSKEYKKIGLGFILFLVMICLIYCLYSVKDDILYSSEMINLYIFIFVSLFVSVLSVLTFKIISFKRKNNSLYYVNLILLLIIFSIGAYYSYLGINAYRYDNSLEVLNLTVNHDLKTAKRYKEQLNEIFEMEDDISIRNVVISSFYNDDENYVLYLDDFYNNYKLKYYLDIDDNEIVNVYWVFNDEKFYLVKDSNKTDEFSYYYAMSIINEVLGEDINGLANIEDEVKKKFVDYFDESANMIISYDEFKYIDNYFVYSCSISNMDYLVNVEEVSFDIVFDRLDKPKNKKIWYYGDSSFDYVDWNVKIK